MPIHIELSVAPHYKHTAYTSPPAKLERTPDSRPPHVIMEWTFDTWQQAQDWHKNMPFVSAPAVNFHGDTIALVLDNPGNEYAQEEIELLEITGTEYTCACLAIEGQDTTNS